MTQLEDGAGRVTMKKDLSDRYYQYSQQTVDAPHNVHTRNRQRNNPFSLLEPDRVDRMCWN
jgi:hypothetical protein